MHASVIAPVLGDLALLLGSFMGIPALLSWAEGGVRLEVFSGTMLVTVAGGLLLRWRRNPAPAIAEMARSELGLREALGIVTLGWLLAGVLGAVPLVASGALPSPIDAFFESVSGFTTTGATVITQVEAIPRPVLLWRSMLQWLGGMGIIVLFVSLVPRMGVSGFQLFRAEFPGPMPEKVLPRVAQSAKILWGVYVAATAVATLSFIAAGLDPFEAVNHAFTSLSTGGYSTRTAGVWEDPWVEAAGILFMFLGGTNFVLQYRLYRLGDWRSLRENTEFWAYLGITAGTTVLVAASVLEVYGRLDVALRKAAFQVVSILSTTGYTSADYSAWPPLAASLIFLVMFIGGMTGSTAGGPKVLRLLVMVKQAGNEMLHLLHPRSVQLLRVGERTIPDRVLSSVAAFLFLYMTSWFVGFVLLAATGLDVVSAASASIASLGNIGPGFGTVGPNGNYAHLSGAAKLILSGLMIVGRLEVYGVLALFHPAFWSRR